MCTKLKFCLRGFIHLYSQLSIGPLQLRLGGVCVHTQHVERVQLIFRDLQQVCEWFSVTDVEYCFTHTFKTQKTHQEHEHTHTHTRVLL